MDTIAQPLHVYPKGAAVEAPAKQRILSPAENNPKTKKLLTALAIEGVILHFAAHEASGHNVCPFASKGCAKACLYTSGHGGMESTQQARVKKTRRFFEDRVGFMRDLSAELEALVRRARKKGYRPVARLNGTSDVDWTTHPIERGGARFPHVFAAFPEIQFYDYTKAIPRLRRPQPENYHLTFSLSEGNDAHALEALALGFNVAVVFPKELPETWGGFPVVDGTAHDFRFLDPQGGHVVGLSAKGEAKRDETGFVRPLVGGFEPTRALNLAKTS